MGIKNLTRRELEVLTLIAAGCKNKEIARQLVVEEGTVKSHIYSIFKKLRVRRRLAAAILFERARLKSDGNQASCPRSA